MEYRTEPRFPVRSPIRVIVPGDPARILNGDLIDVSGTGMRFLADEQVTPDEIVAIEVDSRLVLAEVRYCQTRGYKFVVGVKRLQEVAKGAELIDSGACATEMIRDLRRHISAGGEGDLQALAMKALEKIVERSEIPAGGNESNSAGNNLETLPPEQIPSQPALIAAYGKATNGTAGGHRETPSVAASISSEPRPVGSDAQILPTSEPRPLGSGGQILPTPTTAQLDEVPHPEPINEAPIEALAAGVRGVAEANVASSPALKGGDAAENELQEPPAAIGETPLPEPAAAVPHVLEAEVIDPEVIEPVPEADVLEGDVLKADVLEGDVIEGDVIEGDVIQGDDILNHDPQGAAPTLPTHDHADKPVADLPAEPVSAGIEFRALVAAERPPVTGAPSVVSEGRTTEPVAEAAEIAEAEEVAAIAKVPFVLRAPTGPGAAEEADPLAARRAEMVASYLAADAAGAQVRPTPAWRVPVAIAAALVLACVIIFFLVQRRTQASSLAPQIGIQTPAVAPPPIPAASPAPAALPAAPSPDAPPASLPTPDPALAKKAGAHHARIKVVATSWVMVVADGGTLFQTVLDKDAVHEFDFSQKAFVRLGNAAGAEVTVDGAPVGTLKGKAVLFELTPQGMRYR